MTLTHLQLAQRYLGVKERAGAADHPLIVWWLSLCRLGEAQHDEVAWCSAFMNGLAWELGLPRSGSAAARSWLAVGEPVALGEASTAHVDVVVLRRGAGPQPGPEVLAAPGHVGLFYGLQGESFDLLAGNQGNAVSVAPFPCSQVLGVRRLA